MTGKDEVIPPASKSLSTMLEQGKTVEELQENLSEVHKVPIRDVEKPVETVNIAPVDKRYELSSKFTRGDVVMDIEKDERVVIVRAGIAFSPKGTPFYRVVQKKTGETWIQKESKLRAIR